jgi:hypothetical protein
MGGNRNLSPEMSKAASASAIKICDIVIENRIETAELQVR